MEINISTIETCGSGVCVHVHLLSVCLSVCLPAFSVYVPIQESGGILQIDGRSVENVLRGVTITAVKPADQSDSLVMRPATKVGVEG